MEQSSASRLLSALTAERAALQSFIVLLEREQGMLVENRTDHLLELSEQKSASALDLNKLAESRRALLQRDIPQLTGNTIRDWLARHAAKSLPLWQEVTALTDRARQLNQLNGQLIQAKLRHNQQALAALSNAASRANLYGPDGQPSFSPGSGRSLGSG